MGTAVPIFKTLNKLYLDNYQFSMVSFSKKILKNQQKKLFSIKNKGSDFHAKSKWLWQHKKT